VLAPALMKVRRSREEKGIGTCPAALASRHEVRRYHQGVGTVRIMSRRALLLPVLAVAAVVPAGVAIGAAKKPVKKKPVTKIVHVIDDVYTCAGCKASGTPKAKLTIKKNTTVKWTWSSGNQNIHDVRLLTRPKGVKKFHSELAATDFSFKRTLTKPGTYKIYCSIHTTMRLAIVVKK
jgi:plastocyanin